MTSLDNKIPPPVVLLIVIAAMGAVSAVTTGLHAPVVEAQVAAAVFAVLGLALEVAGVLEFRKFKTTINPLKPDEASFIVKTGVFRFSRNPMYVGMVCLLVGWTFFLATPWALVGPAAFVAFIGRFQIQAEERVLLSRFGPEFKQYMAQVRRWL